MCGICGFSGPPDELVLRRMTNAMTHRGPDEDGFYHGGSVHLGLRRLSIVDPETGHQPVHNETGRIWTICNGEIYNFEDLRAELKNGGHRLYTDHSDTEVLVHLYEEYGIDFPRRLNGMFAIALWDEDRAELVLVRDRMGVKPLYYALVNGELIFGSEIKALLQHPACPREIDPEGISHYFSFKHVPSPLTAFAGIRCLRPGEVMVFGKNGIRTVARYWRMRFDEDERRSEEETAERIFELLSDATRIRMNCDVPYGAYLSGGLDSSLVVGLMRRYASRPIATFCLGYEDDLENKKADLQSARMVSKIFGTDHHEYIMTNREMIQDLPKVLAAFDQPFAGAISTYFLSKLIHRHVKVALSGDGADELFGSYQAHRLAQPMAYLAATGFRPDRDVLDPNRVFLPDGSADLAVRLHRASGGDVRKWRYRLCVFGDEEKETLFSPDFRSRLKGVSSYSLFCRYFENMGTGDPLNALLRVDWESLLPDQVLAFVDFLSMAHSVEVRSPFLDFRLVEYAGTIPGRMKIANGEVKHILKLASSRIIPAEIARRPKEGFVQPSNEWLLMYYERFVREALSRERLRRHGFLDPLHVQRILDEHFARKENHGYKVWTMLNFQVWYETYFG